jgi:hypothetical protein
MQGPVRSGSLRPFRIFSCSKHSTRPNAACGGPKRLRACHECGKWRQLSGDCHSRLRLRTALADRTQQLSSSSEDVQASSSLDATAIDPGVPPPVPLDVEIDLRKKPWAWRRHKLAQMGRFCGQLLHRQMVLVHDVLQSSLYSMPLNNCNSMFTVENYVAGPAVAIPLADPLMSLVDNICIARVSMLVKVKMVLANLFSFRRGTTDVS